MSVNIRKKGTLCFENNFYDHMWPTYEGFLGTFKDFEAQAWRDAS